MRAAPDDIMSETAQSASPTVAVAFGGGGARGLAHIHVIEALDELGIRPVAITGSSIGAIMGAGMAAGMSGADIREFTLSTVGRPLPGVEVRVEEVREAAGSLPLRHELVEYSPAIPEPSRPPLGGI